MEKCFSFDENLDDFSKPLAELYKQEKERKYSNKGNNNINTKFNNKIYCEENPFDQFDIKSTNDLCLEQNLDLFDKYKYNRRTSKSSEKSKINNKNFNLNFSEISENEKKENKKNKNNILLRENDYYYNISAVISEENFSDFNQEYSELPQSVKNQNLNPLEKNILNVNLYIESSNTDSNNENYKHTNGNDNNNNKIRNDFILNFDPNEKNFNYSMKRNQTAKIIKEGILQKKSPWFHYNTRKIVLDSTPRIEYIDPVLNKVKVIYQ